MEIWKKIDRHPNYSISNEGRCRNDKTGKILAQRKDHFGYIHWILNGKDLKAHRLVALAFIPNPDGLPTVNHKNEIKDDNRVENLEWMTIVDNVDYGSCRAKIKKTHQEKYGKKTKAINKTTGEVLSFPSAGSCISELGLNTGSAYKVLKGKLKSTKGWMLEYL